MTDHNTVQVLGEVMAERAAQDRQWGEQNFPFHHDKDGNGAALMGRSYAAQAQAFKDACDARRYMADDGGPDWRSNALVLLEEVFEALAETDLVKIREELVQVAAVAVKAVETIDRARRSGHTAADKRGAVRPCDVLASPLVTGEGTRTFPAGDSDSDHPRAWGGYNADTVAVCGADGCTPDYCPGGRGCRAIAPGAPGWVPRADLATTHLYNGAGRLHGICRCGEDRDAPVHISSATPHRYTAVVDCYADDKDVFPDQIRCARLADHPPHDLCYGNGPFRREPDGDDNE